MKRIVKVLKHSDIANIVINENGDCYDLIAVEDCTITPNKAHLISLGISMKHPSGCVAKLYDRSGNPKKRHFFLANGVGYIDNSYNGKNDIWKFQAAAIRSAHYKAAEIHKGDRICQFEICLSQKATVWQKLLWLFTSGYKFEYVDSLEDNNRGGFGSTDKN
jgi:deoxyuridine 5'-triphosphate nucleotidohydrolase